MHACMSLFSPWLTLVAVTWLQSITFTSYDFPAYSSLLKSRLSLSQLHLNNLAAASDAGKFFAWLSGIAAARLPLWSVFLLGSTIALAGYLPQFLFLTNRIPDLSYYHFLFLQLLAGNSICWFNTACYVACMHSFPAEYSGFVIGLSTSYTGLSAKIYVAVAQVALGRKFRTDDGSVYLLLNSIVPLGLSLVTAPLFRERLIGKPATREANSNYSSGLLLVFVIAGATGMYAVVESLIPGSSPVVLLVMVGLVAGVVILKGIEEKHGVVVVGEGEENGGVELTTTTTTTTTRDINDIDEELESSRREEDGEEIVNDVGLVKGLEEDIVCNNYDGVWEVVRSLEFWLYFMVYLSGGTMGLVYSNNLKQIAESRGVDEVVLLAIFSSFGFFGRLLSAPQSLFIGSKYIPSRPAIIGILMLPVASSFFLLLNPSKLCLFVSTAIISACTGAIISIAVSLTSDLFGPEHFGVNQNLVIANIPLGSLLFGNIAACIYDRQGGGPGGVCLGVDCYRTTFILWGSICFFGTILCFILYIRTRGSLHTR